MAGQNRVNRTLAATLGIVTTGLILSACTSPTGPLSSGEATSLPDKVDSAGVIDGSSRHLGQDSHGFDYFFFQVSTPSGAEDCLMAISDDAEVARACAASPPVKLTFNDITATLHLDPVEDGGDEVVSEYLTVTP